MQDRQANATEVPEVVLSRIWQEGWHAPELRTVDGRRVAVIYRGVWTHADGPDFRDAMLEIDGRLARGSVELHIHASDWRKHGHGSDPAYDSVCLHVVLVNDTEESAATLAGARLPTIELGGYLVAPIEDLLVRTGIVELGSVGANACLPTLAGGRTDLVHAVLRHKGWERLSEKRLRFAQELEALPAGEVLYRGLLDGLGLTANRTGMAAVAETLPLAVLETSLVGSDSAPASALLLGVAGFLPLAPVEQGLAELSGIELGHVEEHWEHRKKELRLSAMEPRSWSLNRVRPANHPVRRLTTLANIVAHCRDVGLLVQFLGLVDDAPTSWASWLGEARPSLGAARIRQIQTNVLAPFLSAYAEATNDHELSDRAHTIWERLPGKVEDAVARSTLRQIVGDARLTVRTALEEQGLHQIGRFGCAQLRCFECPVADLAMRFEVTQPQKIEPSSRH